MNIVQDRHLVKFKGTTRGQKALSYFGARIWNLILSHIETDGAIGTFKKLFAEFKKGSVVDLNLDKRDFPPTLMSMFCFLSYWCTKNQ